MGELRTEAIEEIQFVLDPGSRGTVSRGASFPVDLVWLEK